MPQYVRVATFEMDDTALDALLDRIGEDDSAPDGVPATRFTMLADRAAGRVVVVARFDSEDDLRTGSAVLDGMDPPAVGNRRRVSVESYEIVLEREF